MILVTGGAGFIGSVLIKFLNDQGISNIFVVDRLGNGNKWQNLSGLNFEYFIPADELFDHQKHLLQQVKTIYHLGACSDTTEKDMDFLWRNNFLYSQKLFTFAAQNNIKILYASSAATYGNGREGYVDNHETLWKLRPLNAYGYSKQLFDEWVLRQKRFPPRWLGIKFFNVYGPNEYHKEKMVSVVYQAFHQAQKNEVVRLFKSHKTEYQDGEQVRDFIYVKDAVKAMHQLMEFPGNSLSGIFNLGTGKARSFKDLAAAVFAISKKQEKIEYFEMPEHLRDQYQYHTEASMVKFASVFPDFQFHSLEDGIRDYIQNYLQREDPFVSALT